MKKRLLSIILALAMICSCVAVGTIGAAAETESEPQSFLERFRRDAELVFDDEFDGDTLDETKWQIATGWGRIEDSYGTIEDGNYVVEDGHLALRAFEKVNYDVTNGKESYKEIQSGEVSSKAAWGDGLIEVRAKLPKGQGVYPAIWTMGRDFDRNSCRWPWSGEIDIMEAVGTGNSDDKNYSTWQTLHTARPNTDSSPSGAAHVATGAGKYTTPNHVPLNDDYHTFWVYFDKEIMIIGVDDAMMDIIDLSNPNLVCFKEWEQWLILGLQMGGLAGTPVRTSYSVWEMLIDYVRVYRFKDTEKYKDYKIFEAEDLETSNSVKTIYELTAPTCINNTNIDDIVVNFEDIEPGTYDVYSSYMGTTSANNAVFDTYLNGNKTGTINTAYENGVLEMKDCYMGRVTLEENCSFEARMKYISGKKQAMNVDKFMLVKTDVDDGIIVNKSNEITTYDSIEVSTADELVAAYNKIKTGGTIKLKNDITMTQTISITKDCTLDLSGFTLNTGELEVAFDTAASLTINYINGKIVTPGKNGKLISFFKTSGDKMAHTVKFENVDVTVTAKTVISFLSGYYARCGYYLNNCTFDFSESENDGTTNMYLASSIQDKSNKLQGARMTNLEVTSVTVKGNGNNTPFLLANYNGEAQNFKLRDCTIENCKNVFKITNCDSKKVKVTLANDTFTNLGALTDTDDNLAFITVADNNTVYDNSDNTID
ncbi:MAG: family 16 glycosylhydrolase, partial [Acutalibacteraceae bacterium]